MGLVGMVVVTKAPGAGGRHRVSQPYYTADVPLLFSEIDPVQNNAVNAAVQHGGFSETATHGVSSSGPHPATST